MTCFTLDTPEKIAAGRFAAQYIAAKLFVQTGMGFRAFSNGRQVRDWATSYTGKTYARSRKGMVAALNDMGDLIGKPRVAYE